MKRISTVTSLKRIILGLPGDLLGRVDALAGEEGVARAELIRRALEEMLEKRRQEKERQAALRRRQEALRGMESLAEVFGSEASWKPGEIVREWRDCDRLERHPVQSPTSIHPPRADSSRKRRTG